MSNKLKRKTKKKTVNFGEYTISLPSGTMLESFIKYTAEEPRNISRITDFLDAHSARTRKKIEDNHHFSQQEMDEICEFGRYFMDQYSDEEGNLVQEIADCYDELPFILQVVNSYLDYQEKLDKKIFLNSLSKEELEEAGNLRDKILSTGDDFIISGVLSEKLISYVIMSALMQDPKDISECREDLLCDCAALISEGGFLIVDVIDSENEKAKTFGVAGEETGKWRPMSKEEVEQIVCFDDDGNPIPLDTGEKIVDFTDVVKE